MRFKLYFLFIFVLLIYSCSSVPKIYTGSESTRVSVSTFPTKESWVTSLNNFSNDIYIKSKPVALWNVGLYSTNGVKFNFPKAENNNIENYQLDFNRSYFDFFSQNKIDVVLSIEVDKIDKIEGYIDLVLQSYKDVKCIRGIALDLEWINGDILTNKKIEELSQLIVSYNKKFILVLKDWNIDKLESFYSSNVVYLMDAKGLNSINELLLFMRKWYRKFYPSRIGILVGSENDNYLKELPESNPQNSLYEQITSKDIPLDLFIWNITTFFKL